MNRLLALASAHKVAAATAVAAAVVAGAVVHAAAGGPTTATVARVVDGDTIDVRYDGDVHRVRLLNIDTPESVDPDEPVECLGPEATGWLQQRLPAGTEVRLERDRETQDGYGRELAAVFLGDSLVSAEIARAGLGVAMSVGVNTRYLPPVQAAQAEAQAAGRGLYSTTIECTVPAQVEEVQALTTGTLGQTPPATAALSEFDAHAVELAAALAAVRSVDRLLRGDPVVLPLLAHEGNRLAGYRSRVRALDERLQTATSTNSAARESRRIALEEEARQAAEEAARKAAEEAARLAAEQEAARVAAERAAAQRAAAAAAANAPRPQPPRAPSSGGSGSGSSAPARTATPTRPPGDPGSGSGGQSGYTGCRSYAPGGRTWTPIPC